MMDTQVKYVQNFEIRKHYRWIIRIQLVVSNNLPNNLLILKGTFTVKNKKIDEVTKHNK